MPLDITVTADVLFSETRRTDCWIGTFGWDTKSMDKVRTALAKYHDIADTRDIAVKWHAVRDAVSNWKEKNSKEFENRNTISGGLVHKLAVQCGLDSFRTPPTPAVRFHGELRVAADRRKVPRVTLLDESAVTVLHTDPDHSAVVVIDFYGDDFAAQGLNQYWGTGKTVEQNVIELLKATVVQRPRSADVQIPVYICSKYILRPGDDGKNLWVRNDDEKALVNTFAREIASSKTTYVQSKTMSVVRALTAGGDELRKSLRDDGTTTVFVTGFDANMCVAASIFGPGGTGLGYTPSFLDEGFDVVTSRYLVASGQAALHSKEGWPYMGSCNT